MLVTRHRAKRDSNLEIIEGEIEASVNNPSMRATVGWRGTWGKRPTTSKELRILLEGGGGL